MRRCTAIQPRCWRAATPSYQAQVRWRSYDKASLREDVLLKKAENGLRLDADGNQMKIDPHNKTVSTAAGSLPISPIFDPAWIRGRRRQKKDTPGVATGRFRKKLANNPFARALASPLRQDVVSKAMFPSALLQDFEVVRHPETEQQYWVPGQLAFKHLYPRKTSEADGASGAQDASSTAVEDGFQGPGHEGEATAGVDDAPNKNQQSPQQVDPSTSDRPKPDQAQRAWRPKKAPVTIYTANRKPVVEAFDERRFQGKLISMRNGMAISPSMREVIWVPGMSKRLLAKLRQRAVDHLIERANGASTKNKFVQPVATWDAVKDVKLRGCVLGLPKNTGGDATGSLSSSTAQYATLDVDGVAYGGKMVVYDLFWLLGPDEVQRLKDGAAVFRDNEILVLTQWRSVRMMSLHMLLWRLQGFLADLRPSEGCTSDAAAEQAIESPDT